jgi:hypothetical protein
MATAPLCVACALVPMASEEGPLAAALNPKAEALAALALL